MFDDMQRFENRAFLGLLAAVTLLFIWLLRPFFDVVLWAVVIAVLFTPVTVYLRSTWSMHRNPAALLTLLLCLLLIILPIAWILYSCLQEGAALYERLVAGSTGLADIVDALRKAFPAVQEWLAQYGYDEMRLKAEISRLGLALGRFITSRTMALGGDTATFLTHLAITLYIAFFLLRDGESLAALLIRALPFGDHREKRLFRTFAGAMRATMKGSLLVAAAQGALGGIIFAFLGIHAPVLWGVAMALFALIPVVGAALVWAPAALILLAMGDTWQGLVLIAYGTCIIGLADNLLRPLLVGRDTKLPDFLVLLSTLGGFSLFGMDGFVSGPSVAVLCMTVWQIFIEEREQMYAAASSSSTHPGEPLSVNKEPPLSQKHHQQ